MAQVRTPLRGRASFGLGRAAGALSRATGRGHGGTIPGRVVLALWPQALAELTRTRDVLLVSGTNGKSTTTRFLATAAAWRGPVVSNGDGANLVSGLVSALLTTPERTSTAVLEVDEVAFGAAVAACHPKVAVLLNLSRDQLDRFEEVGNHVIRWGRALAAEPGLAVVANAADPLVVAAVRKGRPDGDRVVWVDAGSPWRADSPLCPACGEAWDLRDVPWHCDSCGLRMPEPTWRLDGRDTVVDAAGTSTRLKLALPGRAAAADAVMAAAAAHLLGVPLEAALEGFGTVGDVGGRYQTSQVGGRSVRLLLAKNPAGWLETLEQLDGEPGAVVLGINARTADGADPSWLWDVDFGRLAGRRVIAFGDRALDLSVRLHYAEVAHEVADSLETALQLAGPQPVCVVANYTAFVGARAVLDGAAR